MPQTGGTRVPEEMLRELRLGMVKAAQAIGYPDKVRNGTLVSFDSTAAPHCENGVRECYMTESLRSHLRWSG